MKTSPSIIRGLSSVVEREESDGHVVYRKQYVETDFNGSSEVIRARTAREFELMRRLESSGKFGRRLGTPHVVDADVESATIVTAEVPGKPLEQYVLGGFRSSPNRECLKALFLAGRWLRHFQNTEMDEHDHVRFSEHDPVNLVEYCDQRMRKVRELSDPWPDDQTRATVIGHLESCIGKSSPEDQQRVWCHCDYTPGNIIWDGSVLTPIDFAMAATDVPLLDVTYFLHRLEMLSIYFPWKQWPISLWKKAVLRGFGRPDAEQSPMYEVMMIRHFLCRLQTYVRRKPKNTKQRLHRKWVLHCVRTRLNRLLAFQETSP